MIPSLRKVIGIKNGKNSNTSQLLPREEQQQIRKGQKIWFQICFYYIFTGAFNMSTVEEVIQTISIGLTAASFFFNTNRFLEAIDLCKDCLFIMKDRICIKTRKLWKSLYIRIYLIMWKSCNRINDNTNAMDYAEKLLQIYRESGAKLEEYKLSFTLGRMYFRQGRSTQAIQLTEKVLLISKEIGDRNGEATCYTNLGIVYHSVGDCEKAKEHQEKALVMAKEIGDKYTQAACYRNLGIVYLTVGDYEKATKHLESTCDHERNWRQKRRSFLLHEPWSTLSISWRIRER